MPELPKSETKVDENWLFFAAKNPSTDMDFGVVARVVASDINSCIQDAIVPMHIEEPQIATIEANDPEKITVLMNVFVNENRDKAWSRLKSELNDINSDYEQLLAEHSKEHKKIFNRLDIDLGANEEERRLSNEELLLRAYDDELPLAMIEKMWAFGRYLLVTGTHNRGPAQPLPLMGLWCGEHNPFWNFHMLNENLQMNYWQSLSGNFTESLISVFDYFDAQMNDFRENARKLYGCRGIYITPVSAPTSGLLVKCICSYCILDRCCCMDCTILF